MNVLLPFVFLGDYIDRGADSRGVTQTIMDMQTADPERVIALAGNHEALLLRADNFIDEARWLDSGGDATLRSYGISSMTEFPQDHLTWIGNLPTITTTNNGSSSTPVSALASR